MAITELKNDLAEKIRAQTGENVYLCYQCVKCTAGCPLMEYFDLAPNQVMRAAQLGMDDTVLNAKTPWLCASCQTCTTRCPQGIDVARVMDFMVMEARARGIPAKVPEVALFNKVFLRDVNVLGRSYELGLILEMNMRTLKPFKDVPMGLKMMVKRKVKLVPGVVRVPKAIRVKRVEATAAQIGYYPGCSLHSTAVEYDHSIRAVAAATGLELVEPQGWVCCGSSPAHRVDPHLATEMPLKNLALLEQTGLGEVTVPCAMCFSRLRTAGHEIDGDPALKTEMEGRIGHHFERRPAVRSLLDVFINRVGLGWLSAQTKKPLAGLKVACYYGCLLTRPPEITGDAHPEYPQSMDRLLAALGATPVDWNSKTTCCGASLSLTRTDIVLDLTARILAEARAAGADAVVVACPLCHMNLDARQDQIPIEKRPGGNMPILYFTQLMAVALGLSEKEAALGKNMVDPRPLLKDKGLLA